MKGIKKVIFIIITVILSIILVINLYSFISIKVFKQDLQSIGGYSILEVVSGSMEPTIHVGDMIIINSNVNEYEENDIVTFKADDGSLITHRIISISEDEIITKGDYNKSKDDPIAKDDIIGKHILTLTGAGKIISAFKSPFTMIMILVIGILVCVFVSTDKNGEPLLETDELEFQEYLKNKENKSTKTKNNKSNTKKDVKKNIKEKKNTTKKSSKKK